MTRQLPKTGVADRESAWRDRLTRFASSSHSVEAFCQSESVSTASFYGWRSKLRAKDASARADRKSLSAASPFIDLGSINAATSGNAEALNKAAHAERRSGLEVRIDLGDGVLLTITRH